MRILMLLEGKYPPDTRVENEIAALAKAGYEIHIACYAKAGRPMIENKGEYYIHRFEISSFTYKSSVGALKLPFYFRFWRKIVNKLMKEYQFDAIHVHDLPLAQIGLEARNKYGVKFILDLHENWPVLLQLSEHTQTFLGKLLSSNKQWVRYEKQMCENADRIIVVVDEAKKRIESLIGHPEKVFVVSNTLNLEQFDPIERKGFNNDRLQLIYVGGINYHRGIQHAIKAIKILKDKGIDVTFNLVGDGRYLKTIRKMVAENQLSENVIIHGFKKFTEIVNLYESADIALIPHVKSGHTDNTVPHKIFQYLYAETPILTSNCDPLVRIVEETHGGLSYHYDNPQELADIIEKFSKDPKQLTQFIGKGRKAVIDRYNWKEDSKVLVGLYHNLLP